MLYLFRLFRDALHVHAQARELAKPGRDQTASLVAPVSEPVNREYRGGQTESIRPRARTQQQRCDDQLANHHS
jgi:hypothetical protein